MQNPLRRPAGNARPPRNRDLERQAPRRDNDYVARDWQGHFVAMTGEFVGTFMFLYFAFAATQIANTITPPTEPNLMQMLFISLAFGFSLAVTAWVFYRISGGLFNPAVRAIRYSAPFQGHNSFVDSLSRSHWEWLSRELSQHYEACSFSHLRSSGLWSPRRSSPACSQGH